MFRKLAHLPLKWKILLGAQATITAVLMAKRVDPNIYDPLFEKRVLIVSKTAPQPDGGSNADGSGSFQVAGFDVQVKKPDKP